METDLFNLLPTAQRLALSYAPAKSRAPTLALLALDARLGGLVRQAREPLLAQIRLAWWRDRLGEAAADWPLGDPGLSALADWRGPHAALVPLVDGWEALLDEGPGRVERLCAGRAAAFAALAQVLGVGSDEGAYRAAREWAAADCAAKLADPGLRAEALALVVAADWHAIRLPRSLRPLAVLHGLARRGRAADPPRILDSPVDVLAAIRIGLSGR